MPMLFWMCPAIQHYQLLDYVYAKEIQYILTLSV